MDLHPERAARAAELGRRARMLRERLAALPVAIAEACCAPHDVAVASYAGGSRPSSTVTLYGGERRGRGEHVGWTAAAHAACATRVAALPLQRCGTVADVARLVVQSLDDPY